MMLESLRCTEEVWGVESTTSEDIYSPLLREKHTPVSWPAAIPDSKWSRQDDAVVIERSKITKQKISMIVPISDWRVE